MKYRKLGRTGLDVSVLALGGSSLGSAFREVEEAEGIRTVHVAIDAGVNLIDTAPFYGLTKAETVLGKALREIPREKYLLATKVGRYGYKEQDFDFSAARVTRSVDESLARLCVDYVDFIQVHDMEFGNIQQIINETIPALRKAQAAGKARYAGITCLPVKLYREVMDHVEVDQVQSYCHYCLNDTALADELPYLRERGVAIFNSAPLAMRLLSDDGPPQWHPAPEQVRAKCAEAAAFCRERNGSLSKLALQYSAANPHIPTNIVGTASPKRILQNIREIEEPLDEELLAGVLAILKPIHNITWPSGRAENNQ
ncbi:MAG TPA: aldo/keto reductase [Chthoniobacteraceae bacterium]|jgi:L-galactose dehydrogenase|nr:aldo/keto reductase [Chthoniobacteraceae bacterium]